MRTREFLNDVCKRIKYKPASKPIAEELEGHIEDLKSEYICKGYSEEISEEKAVEQMGDAKQIGKRLNKIHRPKLDWVTLTLTLVLIFIGGGYVKLMHPEVLVGKGYFGLNDFMTAGLEYIIYILSILFCIFIYFYDYRKICKHSNILYILATILDFVAYFKGSKENGNLLWGLEPFTWVSPTVITAPLYILAFVGFINNINKDSKIIITISDGRKINPNIIKTIVLSCLSIIILLMINFASGFIVTVVYLIIATTELLKRKQIKNTAILVVTSMILFSLLSTSICIIPTKRMNCDDPLLSALWVGVETPGKKRVEFVREEILKFAKLIGKADLSNTYYSDNTWENLDIQRYVSMDAYFNRYEGFTFLALLANYGWIVSLGIMAIIILLNIKLIINATKIKDTYGKLIIIGVASLYIVKVVCHLAMSLGWGIITEFTLPFISEGEVSFLVDTICIALVLSVYRRKNINFEEPKKSKLIAKIEDFFFEEVEEENNSNECQN